MGNHRHNYDDIIDLIRPMSKKHPRMSNANRAKQFSPFAALKGYEEAIGLKEKRYELRKELTEEAQAIIDQKLRILAKLLDEGDNPVVMVNYFVPKIDAEAEVEVEDDGRNVQIGSYTETGGSVQKINLETQTIYISDQGILIHDLIDIQESISSEGSDKMVGIFDDI